jgi:uncharacterized protein (TIGR04255 family)
MEVRFDSKYESAAIFGIIYKHLQDEAEFGELTEILALPKAIIEKDPKLKYQPQYRLINKKNRNILNQIGQGFFQLYLRMNIRGGQSFSKIFKKALTFLINPVLFQV